MSIIEQSQVCWPEDEAVLAAEYGLFIFEDEGHDYYHKWLMSERDHFWNKVFERDLTMMNRFSDLFNSLTAKTTNLYI